MSRKYAIYVVLVVAAIAAGGFYLYSRFFINIVPTEMPVEVTTRNEAQVNITEGESFPDAEVIVSNLTIPWDIAFLPDGTMLVSERPGNLLRVNPENGLVSDIKIEGVEHAGEGGLLGIAIHPRFEENGWIYLYLTARAQSGLINRVERYKWDKDILTERTLILTDIPGAAFHDGGRIEFGPDGYLYITTGDAGRSELAQNLKSLAGKILRVKDDGTAPSDNPFVSAGSVQALIWSYGHRNPQGLAWDGEWRLWNTEHGPSGIWPNCCQDEINIIHKGGNYGWPESRGETVRAGTVGPAIQSGRDVWAPASALYWNSSLFFGGLRPETLYEAVLDGTRVVELREHFSGEFGRIRAVRLGPDGMFYITTSNRDGRGIVREGDDKIIRLNPEQFRK